MTFAVDLDLTGDAPLAAIRKQFNKENTVDTKRDPRR